MLDRSNRRVRKRLAAAERQRRRREREGDGIVMLGLPVNYFQFIEALLIAERISEADALDRAKVATAAAEILGEWTVRWLEK